MRNITFTPGAYSDYIDWLKTDKKLFIKITNLIRETAKNPGEGTGKPELLKHDYSGHWARSTKQTISNNKPEARSVAPNF